MSSEKIKLDDLEQMASEAKRLTPKARPLQGPYLNETAIQRGLEEVEALAIEAKGNTPKSGPETPEAALDRLRLAFASVLDYSYDIGMLFRHVEPAVLAALQSEPLKITDNGIVELPRIYPQLEDREHATHIIGTFRSLLQKEGIEFRKGKDKEGKDALHFWKRKHG